MLYPLGIIVTASLARYKVSQENLTMSLDDYNFFPLCIIRIHCLIGAICVHGVPINLNPEPVITSIR